MLLFSRAAVFLSLSRGSRPGQYALVCGLRTFAAAFPPLDDSEEGPDGHVVVLCGEAEDMSRKDAGATTDAEGRAAAGAREGGAGGGGESVSGVLNTSCLEVCEHGSSPA